jgi:hypothetical protein
VRRFSPAAPREQPHRVAVLRAWPAAWSAGAWPVECSALSNKRCPLVFTPTTKSSWGSCPEPPLCRWQCLQRRPLALDQAPCVRGLADGFSCIAGLLDFGVAGGGCHPTPPVSTALGLSCRPIATAGNEALGRWRLPPPHLRFPLRSACVVGGSLPWATKHLAGGGCRSHPPAIRYAQRVLQAARYRGQRSAW